MPILRRFLGRLNVEEGAGARASLVDNADYRALVAMLRHYRARKLWVELRTRAGYALLATLGLAWLLTLVEAIFWLPSATRQAVVIGFPIGVVLVWGLFIASPLLALRQLPHSWADVGYEVGVKLPCVADRLGNALWIFEQALKDPSCSLELAAVGLRQCRVALDGMNFGELASTSSWRRARRWSGIGVVVSLLLVVSAPLPLRQSWERLIHPGTSYVRGPVFAFQVVPGSAEVLRGSPVEIACRLTGSVPREVSLQLAEEGGDRVRALPPNADSAGAYRWQIPKVERSFAYWILADGRKSERFRITAVEPPLLRQIQLQLVFPPYTGVSPQLLEPNVGEVAALLGTRVLVRGEANKPLSWAAMVFGSGDTAALQVNGARVRGEFTVHGDEEYWFALRDNKGYSNRESIHYRVSSFRDAFPVVSIPVPGRDTELDENMSLPMVLLAEDDFGIASLELRYRIVLRSEWPGSVDTTWKSVRIPLPEGRRDRISVDWEWSLSDLDLLPEDEVEYLAVVRDNDAVTGPKEARSVVYRIRYPSVYELYEEVRRQQEGAYDQLTEVEERAEELRQRIREMAREMLRDAEIRWERREKLAEMAAEEQSLLEKLRTIDEKLDSAVQRMEKNRLVAAETLEKYRQIQELVHDLDSPQIRQALQRLQEALSQLDPSRVQEAMRRLQLSHEDLLQSLDRTIELLKRLRLQQELEEAVAKAEDLLRRQQTLERNLVEGSSKSEQLVDQQRSLARDARDLEEQIAGLARQAEELLRDLPPGLDSARGIADSGLVSSQMQEITEFLQRGQPPQAQRAIQRAMGDLFRLSSNLARARDQMSGREAMEVAQSLSRAAWQALQLSQAQEELWQRLRDAETTPEALSRLAEDQADLRQALDRVAEELLELGRRSFALTPGMSQALGQAADEMNQVLRQLESRNPGPAQRAAFRAMQALNRFTLSVQEAFQQATGSAGQSGLEQWLQQLMGISNQQQWLNQQTLQFGLGQHWGPEERAALEELAARQEALRQLLEQALGEAAGQVGSAGRMDQILEDMAKVADDLRQGAIRKETLDRQQRILSRLLDAQRSVRLEGYSRQRKAETAKQQRASHPERLPSDLGETANSWRKDLLRALKEGYAGDFRRMIEAYFQAMSRNQGEKR
ncbi:MAG: hypothetical protein ONB23_03425 [candidate division KSB1 bacterium]|nr:hypothetical protein [candidate division KSB1 bacterium]